MALPNNICDREYTKFKEDAAGDTSVRTCDTAAQGLLEDILDQLGGSGAATPFFASAETTTTAGGTVSLISFTVPGGTTRKLCKVNVTTGVRGRYNVKINSTIVASGRIGPGNLNHEFEFLPNRTASAGDSVEVEFVQLKGPSGDIEAYLFAKDS